MVTFSVPARSGAAPVSFRVRSHSVAFAGSRKGALTAADAHALVEGFLHLGFGFLTGCAPGIDRCFRSALTANKEAAERTIIACAFPSRERRYSIGEVFATTVVPDGLSPAAALHRRTVWMVRRCSLLVLLPDDPETGDWGRGSRLAFHTARYNLKPVFLVTKHPPRPSRFEMQLQSNLFGVVDGLWVVPHPSEGGTCDEEQ